MRSTNVTEALNASNGATVVPDVSLLIIVIGLMFCMTFCCLCLLCHRTSEFQICGIHFVADTEQTEREPTMEELNEIHEVLPLTPTEGPQYPSIDVEGMLKSDPPPPAYTEAKGMPRSSSFRWKFKSTKRRRNSSTASGSGKQNSFLSKFGPPRLSFRRSQSLNQPRSQLACSDCEIKCDTIEMNPHNNSLEDSSLLGFGAATNPESDSKKLVVELNKPATNTGSIESYTSDTDKS